jgi:hypothetical protein
MEGNLHSVSRSACGDQARLRTRLTSLMNWLGPAWAALCGAVASGGFGWRSADWLRLTLLILLADVGWGVLWAAIGSTDWVAPLRRWHDWRSGGPVARPPYTLPGSPGDIASRWLGQLRAWWHGVFWPACGLSLSAIVVALLGTVALGVLLGADLLLLNVAALAVMQLGLAWGGGRGTVGPTWDALVAVALPWLAGHMGFETLTLASFGLAVASALAWGAAGRWLGIGAQVLVAVLLVVLHSPLAAGGVLVLLVPQLMLVPWLRRGQPSVWYVRYTRPWVAAAMMIAAWAL